MELATNMATRYTDAYLAKQGEVVTREQLFNMFKILLVQEPVLLYCL